MKHLIAAVLILSAIFTSVLALHTKTAPKLAKDHVERQCFPLCLSQKDVINRAFAD
jgi:hypothetical protein